MAVYADEKQRTFTLQTKNTTYQMKVDAYGMLLHTYYGEKTDNSDLSYRIPPDDRGFSGYAYEASCADDRLSSDLAPQEYSCFAHFSNDGGCQEADRVKGQRGVDTASGYKADCHCFTDRTADTEDDGGCDTGFGCRDRYTENCLDPGSTQTQGGRL